MQILTYHGSLINGSIRSVFEMLLIALTHPCLLALLTRASEILVLAIVLLVQSESQSIPEDVIEASLLIPIIRLFDRTTSENFNGFFLENSERYFYFRRTRCLVALPTPDETFRIQDVGQYFLSTIYEPIIAEEFMELSGTAFAQLSPSEFASDNFNRDENEILMLMTGTLLFKKFKMSIMLVKKKGKSQFCV